MTRTKTEMIMVVMVVVMMIAVIKTNIWVQACGEESLFIYPDLVTCLVITKLTCIPHNHNGASSTPPLKLATIKLAGGRLVFWEDGRGKGRENCQAVERFWKVGNFLHSPCIPLHCGC